MSESENKFGTLSNAVSTNRNVLRSASSPEEAYQIFMNVLGEGFTQVLGDAVASALDSLQDAKGEASSASDKQGEANIGLIIDTLSRGSHASLQFSTPGIGIPTTKKVNSTGGVPNNVTTLKGGSVGVTGTYEF